MKQYNEMQTVTRGCSLYIYIYIYILHKSILTMLSIPYLLKSNDCFVWETDPYLTHYLNFSPRRAAPKYFLFCTFKHVTLHQETHENQWCLTSLTSNLVQIAYLKMQMNSVLYDIRPTKMKQNILLLVWVV